MKPLGLSKKERLLKPVQFKNVYLDPRAKKGSPACQIYFKDNGLDYNRLGISISRRTCRTSVMRNRIKRILRQVYQHNKQVFGQGQDIIIVVKKIPGEINYAALEKTTLSMVSKQAYRHNYSRAQVLS
ncbi:MAG: ribonuclease P protein component [Candidatus Omnitrophica bacterium]|nr:ribonuclease P protein component [Candidatus Omnitrophota bacterium]MBU1925348.1 ribonuclease P protein component [Candidatus Omnitrophota bacterium]